MPSDQIPQKSFFSVRNMAFALLLALFAAFVISVVPGAISSGVDANECIGQAEPCLAKKPWSPNYALWAGIYLFSLFGLILMTFKSARKKNGPTLYLSLATAAALNTLMWMALVYAGTFVLAQF